jgi:hypothetical protein
LNVSAGASKTAAASAPISRSSPVIPTARGASSNANTTLGWKLVVSAPDIEALRLAGSALTRVSLLQGGDQ